MQLDRKDMRPKKPEREIRTASLFAPRLEDLLDRKNAYYKLAGKIDWEWLDQEFGKEYSRKGRCGVPTRLLVGLHLIKHTEGISDEKVCRDWVMNPYYQYFCGEEYLQFELPIDRSSMSNWRKRMGEEKLEKLISETLRVACEEGAMQVKDAQKVIVDSTVMEKNITFPTDAKLALKALRELAKLSRKHDVKLRQTYEKEGKYLTIKVGRYLHAKQYNRARTTLKKLKRRLGRVRRDIIRKTQEVPELQEVFQEALKKAWVIENQTKRSEHKLFSWHAPETECIGKGKARQPWEFGVKVSVCTTAKRCAGGVFVLASQAVHGKPYDGHTLDQTLQTAERITGIEARRIYVDKGYVGHDYEKKGRVFRSGQKRGVKNNPEVKAELRRRSSIEPVIGHMKRSGHLKRNFLKGVEGNRTNAVLCGAGQNMRLLLKWMASFYPNFARFLQILSVLKMPTRLALT